MDPCTQTGPTCTYGAHNLNRLQRAHRCKPLTVHSISDFCGCEDLSLAVAVAVARTVFRALAFCAGQSFCCERVLLHVQQNVVAAAHAAAAAAAAAAAGAGAGAAAAAAAAA